MPASAACIAPAPALRLLAVLILSELKRRLAPVIDSRTAIIIMTIARAIPRLFLNWAITKPPDHRLRLNSRARIVPRVFDRPLPQSYGGEYCKSNIRVFLNDTKKCRG